MKYKKKTLNKADTVIADKFSIKLIPRRRQTYGVFYKGNPIFLFKFYPKNRRPVFPSETVKRNLGSRASEARESKKYLRKLRIKQSIRKRND